MNISSSINFIFLESDILIIKNKKNYYLLLISIFVNNTFDYSRPKSSTTWLTANLPIFHFPSETKNASNQICGNHCVALKHFLKHSPYITKYTNEPQFIIQNSKYFHKKIYAVSSVLLSNKIFLIRFLPWQKASKSAISKIDQGIN